MRGRAEGETRAGGGLGAVGGRGRRKSRQKAEEEGDQ